MVKDIDDLRTTVRTIYDAGVKITINTDGPEMYQSNICDEENLLENNNILSKEEIAQCRQWAFEASFLKSHQ